jgi:hypothetical protein
MGRRAGPCNADGTSAYPVVGGIVRLQPGDRVAADTTGPAATDAHMRTCARGPVSARMLLPSAAATETLLPDLMGGVGKGACGQARVTQRRPKSWPGWWNG